MLSRDFQDFQDPRLSGYEFSSATAENDERFFGVDQKSNIWKGKALLEFSQSGLIIKTFAEQDIILKENGGLLGYIRECPDHTYLAHSCYFSGTFDWVEAHGFQDKFYAIIYLHEILIKRFPKSIYPALPDKRISDVALTVAEVKDIYIQELDAKIGYIQQVADSLWMANSFYHPKNMAGLRVVGFLNEFYASRYLFQLAEAFFPDAVHDIPELSWKYMND